MTRQSRSSARWSGRCCDWKLSEKQRSASDGDEDGFHARVEFAEIRMFTRWNLQLDHLVAFQRASVKAAIVGRCRVGCTVLVDETHDFTRFDVQGCGREGKTLDHNFMVSVASRFDGRGSQRRNRNGRKNAAANMNA